MFPSIFETLLFWFTLVLYGDYLFSEIKRSRRWIVKYYLLNFVKDRQIFLVVFNLLFRFFVNFSLCALRRPAFLLKPLYYMIRNPCTTLATYDPPSIRKLTDARGGEYYLY